MKKSKSSNLAVLIFLVLSVISCAKPQEDPDNLGNSIAPTIIVYTPNNNTIFYTSGERSVATFHFEGKDDVTVDWVAITVLDSSGAEMHYEKKVVAEAKTAYRMYRSYRNEVAGTYTVIFEVSDTANNVVEARRTIVFQDRTDGGTDATDSF